ncbi:MAG: hypothetical protein OS130_12410 [Thermodesulfobacteriota bacterium]|jgi:spermidine synthase|nr:MAG: hypothetical protein OS130_12410 [Thermodesulfobacteriota bacterium]
MNPVRFLKQNPFFLAFFLLGAYSIATQVLLIREFLVIFFGNELCMGIIFSAWLLSIFLGAILAARIVSHTQRTLVFFIVIQYILLLLPAIQIILIRNLRLFLHIPSWEYIPFFPMISSIFPLLFPFCFLIGFIFPFAISIYTNHAKTTAQRIGAVYVYESLGSMLSGAVLTFYLLLHYSPFLIIAFFTAAILFNAFFLTQKIRENFSRFLLFVFWGILFSAVSGLSYFHCWDRLEHHTVRQRWESISPQIDFVHSTNSPYQNIVIAKRLDQYSLYGNGQIFTSFPDPYQSALKAHFILCEHPRPEKVLLIGGGISGIIKEILKHPVKTLHYVELDPTLVEMGKQYLPADDTMALKDPRVTIFLTDGRYYVKKCQECYDVIILNLPDPTTALLNRFYTLNFFREITRILKTDGLLVTGVRSSENFIGQDIGRYTASVYHSLTRVFPYVLVTPGDYNYFFACRFPSVVTADINILAKRYLERDIKTPYFSPHLFTLFIQPERVSFVNKAIKKISTPYTNTDERPISYFYTLILWDIFSGGKGQGFFQRLNQLSWEWFFLPLGLIVVLRFLYLVTAPKQVFSRKIIFNSLYAIFATGFAAMGLEIILLFAYQNHYGCLYQKIGIIVALFMAGLAAGAQIMNRRMTRPILNGQNVLLAWETAITAFSLLLPLLLALVFQANESFVLSEMIFMMLVFVTGVLTGAEFPLVNEILIKHGLAAGISAGKVDGYDHLGAAVGGALTGTLLVPLLGTLQSCLFIAGLNVIACFFLAHSRFARNA